jgi:uncharacterized RDD family membrane protein YckC
LRNRPSAKETHAVPAVTEDAVSQPAIDASAGPRVRVAGFWRRFAASIVDGALLAVVCSLLWTLAAALLGRPLPRLRQLGPDALLDVLVNGDAIAVAGLLGIAFVTLAYFTVFHAALGATVGKHLCGLRVIDGYGERPTVLRSSLRALAYIPSALVLMLGFLWIGFDREKRGLHDWIADTYVVNAGAAK